jgi:hypothetical protein
MIKNCPVCDSELEITEVKLVDYYCCKTCHHIYEKDFINSFKKCEDCLARYTGSHDCPPWLKALVKSKNNQQK